MSLASQRNRSGGMIRGAARAKGGGGRRRRRRKKPTGRIFGVLVMLALAVGIWWFWPEPAGVGADGPTVNDPLVSAENGALPEARGNDGTTRINATNASRLSSTDGTKPVTMTMGTPIRDQPADGANALSQAINAQANKSNENRGALPNTSKEPASSRPAGTPATTPRRSASAGAVLALIRQADSAQQRNRLVEARALYIRALLDGRATEMDRALIRSRMGEISDTLTFSPVVVPDDPLSEKYTVRPGDSLSKIANKQSLGVDWRFIQRINGISDPRKIRVGQTIKLVRGPFHAVVSKDHFRLDLFAITPPDAASGGEAEPMFIRSFDVGLGEYGATPVGSWIVRTGSKLMNPEWVNPRTHERFAADDEKNPIGERWIGLRGADDRTRAEVGYGIHGTVDPDSIGKNMSMGCIRMRSADVEIVYEMLAEGRSTVQITP